MAKLSGLDVEPDSPARRPPLQHPPATTGNYGEDSPHQLPEADDYRKPTASSMSPNSVLDKRQLASTDSTPAWIEGWHLRNKSTSRSQCLPLLPSNKSTQESQPYSDHPLRIRSPQVSTFSLLTIHIHNYTHAT